MFFLLHLTHSSAFSRHGQGPITIHAPLLLLPQQLRCWQITYYVTTLTTISGKTILHTEQQCARTQKAKRWALPRNEDLVSRCHFSVGNFFVPALTCVRPIRLTSVEKMSVFFTSREVHPPFLNVRNTGQTQDSRLHPTDTHCNMHSRTQTQRQNRQEHTCALTRPSSSGEDRIHFGHLHCTRRCRDVWTASLPVSVNSYTIRVFAAVMKLFVLYCCLFWLDGCVADESEMHEAHGLNSSEVQLRGDPDCPHTESRSYTFTLGDLVGKFTSSDSGSLKPWAFLSGHQLARFGAS